jgi:hypothetical protein
MPIEASLLFLAAASAWLRPLWPVTLGLFAAAYAWGLASGFVGPASPPSPAS